MNNSIFVIYHKPYKAINTDVYHSICVGENKDLFSDEFLRDDSGDNIANKNDLYNELTAIYWVYKNIENYKDVENFGFVHYRRFFSFSRMDKTLFVTGKKYNKLIELDDKTITKFLSDFDFVVPYPSYCKSVERHYEKSHNSIDLKNILNVIEQYFPEYYDDSKEYLSDSREYLYNMFIFKKEHFLEYGKFVFGVLDKYLSLYQNAADRLYVSERLTGMFIYHLIKKGLKPFYLPVVFVREKNINIATKQTKSNFKKKKDRGFFYKIKPMFLWFVPRFIEQALRRRKITKAL